MNTISTTHTDQSLDTAIITVTYNCEDFIEDFLSALKGNLQSIAPRAKLFVVDNASSDRTVDVIRRFVEAEGLQERVVLLPQDTNLGFGTGCNVGADAAHELEPEYYWFLNPDTRVFPETQTELIKFFRLNPAADFVGSQLVNEHQQARPSAFRFPSVVSEFCRTLRLGVVDRLFPRGQIAIPVSNKPHRADWLTGASFMVKSGVFHRLGGFDPAYFLYFEEVDLFLRAKQQGFTCWFNPESKVYHYAGASTGISSSRKATKPRPQYWFDSRRYFYCKNHGQAYFALCDLAAMLGLSLWKLRLLVQKKDSSDPPGLLKAIASNSLFVSRTER